jgi:hypothetical protein
MNEKNFEQSVENGDEERKKKLNEILGYLEEKEINIPNVIYSFVEYLGWTAKTKPDLLLDAVRIGFYDVVKKIKDDLDQSGVVVSATEATHQGTHVETEYIREIKPFISNEQIDAIGNALAELLAKVYESYGTYSAAAIFYRNTGEIERADELDRIVSVPGYKNEYKRVNEEDLKGPLTKFLEVANQYEITEAERARSISNIKETVEKELEK